jgi:DNA topoisomerase-1
LEKARYSVLNVKINRPAASRRTVHYLHATAGCEHASRLRCEENHDDGAALYEAGYITYMRTDSTNLSQDAVTMVRDYISDNFGKKYLPKTRTSTPAKRTRRKHEAIRPS